MASPEWSDEERGAILDRTTGPLPWLKPRERKRMTVKIFKSGNSMAMRLPASLGLLPGSEIELEIEDNAHVSFDLPDTPKRKLDVAKFWGLIPELQLIPEEDRLFTGNDDDR